jgi:ATP-binding cassette subfamily B protein
MAKLFSKLFPKKILSFPMMRKMNRNIARINKLIWQEKKAMFVGLVVLFLLISAAPFLQSGIQGLLINRLVEGGGLSSELYALIVGLVAVSIVAPLIMNLQQYVSKLFWFFLEEKFSLLIVRRKGEIDVAVHEDPKQNDLFNKITENGVWRVQDFVDRQFYILQDIISVIIAAAILIVSQWWVFLILLAGTIPELLVELAYGKDVWGIHTSRAEIRRKYWNLTSYFQSLPTIVELKLFQNTRHFASRIRDLFLTFQSEQRRNEQVKLRREIAAVTVSQLAAGFAVAWFIIQVVQGHLLVGTLVFILYSTRELRSALSGLFMNLGHQYQDNLFVSDVFTFIDIKPALKRPTRPIQLASTRTPQIVFENVSFTYPETTKEVLKDFSLTIEPGEKIALVGVNGAGKTTIVKLLCRFYDPTQGRILVDGNDLRAIDIESWYALLGALFQDYSRYYFPVKEAIGMGNTAIDLSMGNVQEAARASEADIFIDSWKGKYDQMLGREFSGGLEPSVGQWQKLALARTFYRDPRIMILDEPTSSIDAEAEAKIFEKLESLPGDRTVFLISHRFSTVRKANKIIVLEQGGISEMGTHEDLIKLDGTYARLFNMQAKGYK